jgi:hypothetical protein
MAAVCLLFASMFAAASAVANTGSTGETTWVNAAGDPPTTNQFSSDTALGCPTTIDIWDVNMPAFDGPKYFHVDSIAPTDDPFVHASGMFTSTVGSSTPEKIASIDTATLIQNAHDTGQPLDSNGQGYHYRLVFDNFLTSTVDFWVNCAVTNPPVPTQGPTPAPQPTPTPTPAPQPSSDSHVVTVNTPPAQPTTTATGSHTTTSTPSTCTRLIPRKVFKLAQADYYPKVKNGKVRLVVKVTDPTKYLDVNAIRVQVINGKHKYSFTTTNMKFTERWSIRNKSIWGSRSWKRARVHVVFYRTCGSSFYINFQ